MGAGTVAAGVEIPPELVGLHAATGDFGHELVVAFLADRAANDFTNLGEENIGTLHSLTVCILLHVESLDGGRVVGHDDRLLEVGLNEVALVLGGEVVAPLAWELKFVAVGNGLLEDIDALGVGQADETFLQDTLEALDERLVDHLVEELQVVLTVVERPAHTVLDEVLLEVHESLLVEEGYLGLNHPELGEVARGVAVLGAESGTEGVDGAKGRGTELALQLSGDGERGLLAEEVVVVDDAALLVLLQVVEVLGGHLEHISSAFAVGGGDERRVKIVEAVLMEIGVDGHGHVVANAHNGTEGVGAQAQMGVLAHGLERLALLLHGIGIVAETIDLEPGGLDLAGLTGALTLNQNALGTNAGAGCDVLEQLFVELRRVDDHLNVVDGGTVVEGNEVDGLRRTVGTYPALHADFLAEFCAFQHINYPCTFHSYLNLRLFVSTHAETVDFLLSEVAPVATTEVLLGKAGELYAVKLENLVAQSLEDAAHDAVLAGVNLNTHLLLVDSIGILDIIGLDLAILELYALGNLSKVVGGDVFVEVDVVDLLL